MLLSLFKTSGHSMEPEISNGSFFLGSSIPYYFTHPNTGDKIVFKYNGKIIVKEIVKIESGKYFTQGLNLNDSKQFDPIKKNEILGKVIWIF